MRLPLLGPAFRIPNRSPLMARAVINAIYILCGDALCPCRKRRKNAIAQACPRSRRIAPRQLAFSSLARCSHFGRWQSLDTIAKHGER